MSALASTVRDNSATHLYELFLDGELVGACGPNRSAEAAAVGIPTPSL